MVILVKFITAVLLVRIAVCDYSQPINGNGEKFDLTTLKYVTVISRHGSRSPHFTYPKDCCPFHDARFWPDGFLQLTKYGKRQAHELGRHFRQRYDGFINNVYFTNETMFLSNIDERELCSAQLIASGMFPPTEFQKWDERILWQPISVFPVTHDTIHIRYFCRRFVEMVHEVKRELFAELAKSDNEFINEVAYFSGLDPTIVLDNLISIWQTLELQRENGYPNPEWADIEFLNRLHGLSARIMKAAFTGNQEIVEMTAGPTLLTIVEELNNKSRSALIPDRKMTIFATHDTTILAALLGLGIDEPLLPATASSLAFELHDYGYGPIVQVLYFNHSSTPRPTLFKVPGCPNPCPLSRFTRIAARVFPNNPQMNCTALHRSKSASAIPTLSSAVLVSALVHFLLVHFEIHSRS